MKKTAILQSNYIPWKGYFDIINSVDDFVIYDDVQYTKRDWRNRNKIKTSMGSRWLTIPVIHERQGQKIIETKVVEKVWRKKHWSTLKLFYGKSKFFRVYKDMFEDIYLNDSEIFLSKINYKFIVAINGILGIKTCLHWSSDFDSVEGKSGRLLNICKELSSTTYLSGPAAKDYLDESLFESEGVSVEWMDYSSYPKYEQLNPPFEHGVTILDLIFNEGTNAPKYMKSFK